MGLFGDDPDDGAEEQDDPLSEGAVDEPGEESEPAGPGVLETVRVGGIEIGKGIGNGLILLVKIPLLLVFSILSGVLKPIPGLKTKFWKALGHASLKQYHKNAGGDRLGLEATPAGKVKLTPVKYRPSDQCELDEKPGWKAKGRDKVWKPTTLGQDGLRLGKIPVVPLDTESWRATSVLEARVAEAVDQGDTRPMYRVDEAELTATLDATGGTSGGAVADGGTQITDIEFNPRSSPIFDDTIIDLGSEDYDGQAVSWEKSKELFLERTGTEEMDAQEERGFLAGRSKGDMKSLMLKLFAIAAAVAITGLVGKEVVGMIFGGGESGGGGGGGGGLPLTTMSATLGNLVGW